MNQWKPVSGEDRSAATGGVETGGVETGGVETEPDETVRVGRQWPRPARIPSMKMVWHDLLFLHWPISVDELRPVIPDSLEVDTYQGQAWIAIVPFSMSGIRPPWCPALPWVSAFAELNVRTYVTCDGKPGVWFFSLDAGNPLAVRVARSRFWLPYFDARIRVSQEGNQAAAWGSWIRYHSRRTHHGCRPAEFLARYRPVGELTASGRTTPGEPAASCNPGSSLSGHGLERWLTERYCLYVVDRQGLPWRGEIDHQPWPLQPAEVEIEKASELMPDGITLPRVDPLAHFARRLEVVAWSIQKA